MKTAFAYNRENFQKTVQTMSYDGSDVKKWQKAAREKLAELLGIDTFVKVAPETEIEYKNETDEMTEIRFTFASEAGYRVPCHLLLPKGKEKPPVMIALQGHSKGMHISLGRPKFSGDEKDIVGGDRDFCVRALKEGFASVALEQRNFGECGGSERGPQCHESAMTAIMMGRTTIGERVWDVMRLIDVLESEFSDLVDVKAICCMGNSGGGTTTAYTAALEDRIALAMPSCAVSSFGDSICAMHHCSCNYVPNIAKYFDMGDLVAMSYPKYYVQVNGMKDGGFPIEPAEREFLKGKAAYDKENAGDRCTLVKGAEGHRFYADDSWPVVHKYIGK